MTLEEIKLRRLAGQHLLVPNHTQTCDSKEVPCHILWALDEENPYHN